MLFFHFSCHLHTVFENEKPSNARITLVTKGRDERQLLFTSGKVIAKHGTWVACVTNFQKTNVNYMTGGGREPYSCKWQDSLRFTRRKPC